MKLSKIIMFDNFTGWLFFGIGALVIGMSGHVAYQTNSNFIENEEIFRAVIIGLVLFMGGIIILSITRLYSKMTKEVNGS